MDELVLTYKTVHIMYKFGNAVGMYVKGGGGVFSTFDFSIYTIGPVFCWD
jgi:predicted amidohydrolase